MRELSNNLTMLINSVSTSGCCILDDSLSDDDDKLSGRPSTKYPRIIELLTPQQVLISLIDGPTDGPSADRLQQGLTSADSSVPLPPSIAPQYHASSDSDEGTIPDKSDVKEHKQVHSKLSKSQQVRTLPVGQLLGPSLAPQNVSPRTIPASIHSLHHQQVSISQRRPSVKDVSISSGAGSGTAKQVAQLSHKRRQTIESNQLESDVLSTTKQAGTGGGVTARKQQAGRDVGSVTGQQGPHSQPLTQEKYSLSGGSASTPLSNSGTKPSFETTTTASVSKRKIEECEDSSADEQPEKPSLQRSRYSSESEVADINDVNQDSSSRRNTRASAAAAASAPSSRLRRKTNRSSIDDKSNNEGDHISHHESNRINREGSLPASNKKAPFQDESGGSITATRRRKGAKHVPPTSDDESASHVESGKASSAEKHRKKGVKSVQTTSGDESASHAESGRSTTARHRKSAKNVQPTSDDDSALNAKSGKSTLPARRRKALKHIQPASDDEEASHVESGATRRRKGVKHVPPTSDDE